LSTEQRVNIRRLNALPLYASQNGIGFIPGRGLT